MKIHTLFHIVFSKTICASKFCFVYEYPKLTLNKREIIQSIEHLDLFMVGIGEYQFKIYNYILKHLEETLKTKVEFEDMEKFGYTFYNILSSV